MGIYWRYGSVTGLVDKFLIPELTFVTIVNFPNGVLLPSMDSTFIPAGIY